MRISRFVKSGALSMLEIGIEAARPMAEAKSMPQTSPEIDTQELTEMAARISQTDPSRAHFAHYVMVELGSKRITAEQAAYYLTPPEER